MYADTNERRGAAEAYLSATGSSSLRSVQERDGAIESIGAAGMNPYQTGVMLMRLQAEWDRASKPKPPTKLDFERIAGTLKKIPAGEANAGMVEESVNGKSRFRKPFEVAERTAIEWHLHELGILASHLKTLPDARAELESWLGGPHADRVVADVLAWWLQPRCPYCRGVGKRVIEGTGGRDSGKVCWACRFSPVPGERPLPHSGVARRLLGHIRSCYGMASKDQGNQRAEHRPAKAKEARDVAKKHAQVGKLRRADDETRNAGDREQEAATVQAKLAHLAASPPKPLRRDANLVPSKPRLRT
jgi:hypothetical protein